MSTLRAEASPVSWVQLTSSEQSAFVSILHHLNDAMRAFPAQESHCHEPSPRSELLPALGESNPLRRLLFLTGSRGSGKTTVLLSLLSHWAGMKLFDRRFEVTDPNPTSDKSASWERLIATVRERSIWLDPLTLDTLPKSANLLAAVLVRIEKVAEKIISRPTGVPPGRAGAHVRGCGDLLAATETHINALQELQRLLSDVALAWEGNLRSRGSHLDPEPYAAEVLHAEHARLEVNKRLGKVLDGIADQCRTVICVDRPIFVLSIDDFDTNPMRCIELLQMLQMLNVPQLFTLVLGDLDVAEKIWSLHSYGELARISRITPLLGGNERGPLGAQEPLHALSELQAREAARKLIPPAQRIKLGPMTIAEALEYGRDTSPEVRTTVQDLLSRIPLVPQRGKTTGFPQDLSSLLLLDALRGETAPAPSPHPYSALAIFEVPARQVADLWHALHNLSTAPTTAGGSSASSSELLRLVAKSAIDCIAFDASLSDDERRDMQEAIQPDATQGWELDRTLVPELEAVRRAEQVEVLNGLPLLRLGLHGGWSPASRPGRRCLERITVGWFALLHDLLVLTRPRDIVGPSLLPRHFDGRLAEALVPGSVEATLPWPLPNWQTFREYDRFVDGWRHALQCLNSDLEDASPNERIESLLFWWIDLGTATLAGSQLTSGLKKPSADEWKALTDRLDFLARSLLDRTSRGTERPGPVEKRHRERHESWLALLAVLLAPESGTPSQVAAHFLHTPNLRQLWCSTGVAVRIRTWRAERLSKVHEDDQTGFGVLSGVLAEGRKHVFTLQSASMAGSFEKITSTLDGLLTQSLSHSDLEANVRAVQKMINEWSSPLPDCLPAVQDWLSRVSTSGSKQLIIASDRDVEREARAHVINAIGTGILRPTGEDLRKAGKTPKARRASSSGHPVMGR